MALFVDEQTANTTLKHLCRICKKGFGCGRALGGHMRAHGIGAEEDSNHNDDENDNNSSDDGDNWDNHDKAATNNNNASPSNKRMYALRANPNNRLRSNCRACEHCGKEFSSWKSFLEHGKCGGVGLSDDDDDFNDDNDDDDDDDIEADSLDSKSNANGNNNNNHNNWSKRKRSFRSTSINNNNNKVQNHHQIGTEEEDLANCLMMLSNAAVEPEESCASASRDEKNNNNNNNAAIATTHFNVSPVSFRVPSSDNNNNINNNIITTSGGEKAKGLAISAANNNNKGLFECKACKKVFNSHQALGGHRASHKKVKGCFAARLPNSPDDFDNAQDHRGQIFASKPAIIADNNSISAAAAADHSKRRSKVHECSICHRIFSSGQALGGHKRCHWITSNAGAPVVGPGPEATAALAKFQESIEQINLAAVAAAAMAAQQQHQHHNNHHTINNNNNNANHLDLKLDLNLPAEEKNVSTEIFLQPWMVGSSSGVKLATIDDEGVGVIVGDDVANCDEGEDEDDDDEEKRRKKKKSKVVSVMSSAVMEDEADSKVKLAKLSELKEMNVSEGSSPWLQVGIGSTTDVGSTVP